jgi:hypothetical protein
MKRRTPILELILGALLVLTPPALAGEYPETMEGLIHDEIGRVLSSLEYGTSFRACLLSEEELLLEVTLRSPLISEPARDAAILMKAREAVSVLMREEYPGIAVSDLSTFRLKPSPFGQPMYALKGS